MVVRDLRHLVLLQRPAFAPSQLSHLRRRSHRRSVEDLGVFAEIGFVHRFGTARLLARESWVPKTNLMSVEQADI